MAENNEVVGQEAAEQDILSRRNFFNWVIGAWVAIPVLGSIYPLLKFLIPVQAKGKEGVLLDAFGKAIAPSALKNPKGYVVGKAGKDKVIVFNYEGEYKAMSAICSHLGCLVKYNSNQNVIICPCHSGTYNPTTGEVMSGPPPNNLKMYKVEITDEEVKVI